MFNPSANVCRLCRASVAKGRQQGSVLQPWLVTIDPIARQTFRPKKSIRHAPRRHYAQPATSATPVPVSLPGGATPPLNLDKVNAAGQALLKKTSIPTEEETLLVLKAIESDAQHVADARRTIRSNKKKDDNSPTSAMLSLDSRPSQSLQPTAPAKIPAATVDLLSSLAYKIITHPTVFINPDILSTYVSIQSLLLRPASLPQIFDLYATKPIPKPPGKRGSNTIQYKPQSPKAITSAVPADVASKALDAAIEVRQLPLALDIISTSFCTPAFRRNKLFRKALPPAVGVAAMPVAVYVLSSQLALHQAGLPPEMFAPAAFAAIFTYVTSVTTIGYIAITTTNDHMERVTWIEGTPLWQRWVREEERAALDKVAMAWGFRERWRWGEEEGAEWEGLKEWVGIRGMILDKVSLMEGME